MDLQALLSSTQTLIATNPWLAFAAVFAGGALTASNPCVLAMIPLVIGFVGGYRGLHSGRRAFGFSLLLVLGLSTTFTLMGVAAALMGTLFGDAGRWWPWVIAAVCFAMAAHLWDLWSFSLPGRLASYRPRHAGGLGAFLLGMLFGVVSAPCAAPILVVLLTFIAGAKGAELPYALALLWTYALGHCLLVLAAGTSMGFAKGFLESTRLRAANHWLKRAAGLLIAAVGLYVLLQSLWETNG